MLAEIIAIGDEITSGQLLDTNTQWLSQRVEESGIRVLYHTTVGDQLDAITDVLRRAIERADLIITTGGLGPTDDDLTRQAIADAAGRQLVVNAQALAHVRGIFARRNRPMPPKNEIQALLPEGGRIIHNPHGTAPGVEITIRRKDAATHSREHLDQPAYCLLFALPGVPAEMRDMWSATLQSVLHNIGAGKRVVRHRKIKCFGAGESQIEAMLPDLIRRGREPRVGINASKTTIILRITAEGATQDECDAAIKPTVATIRECLGDLIFGEGDDELQHAVCRLLQQHGKTLATAEWGTAGLVADWLGEVDGAREICLGGLTVSNPATASRVLNIPQETLRKAGSISEAVAVAMARACREQFATDYALAVGPFPPFDPNADSPAPFWLALATPRDVTASSYPYAAHPALLKILSAKRALNTLRLALL